MGGDRARRALLKVAPGLELRGSAYTGLRQPTINELYRSFTLVASGVSTVTNANAALGNEMMEGYEAGVDFTPVPALKLSATAFTTAWPMPSPMSPRPRPPRRSPACARMSMRSARGS
jgi:hypothetical protein